jgi:hypothetical protein
MNFAKMKMTLGCRKNSGRAGETSADAERKASLDECSRHFFVMNSTMAFVSSSSALAANRMMIV